MIVRRGAAAGAALAAWSLLPAGATPAGDRPTEPTAVVTEAGFERLLESFREALADEDWARVARLTRVPFRYEGAWLDTAGLQRALPELFTAAVRDCFDEARPLVEEGRYVVFCPPYGFYFGRDGETYRLLEFMADGEG